MQALTVTDSLVPISRQLQAAVRTLAQRERLTLVLACFGAATMSAVLAPGAAASLWDWTRLLLIMAAGTVAGAALAATRDAVGNGSHLALALAATSLALALAATFGLMTAALCSLALSTVEAAVITERLRHASEGAAAALAVLTPWWVWTALDVWDDRLLLLAPLAALGLNALAHARLALAGSDLPDGPPLGTSATLSTYSHRLGVWLSLAAGAALLLVVGVATGAAGDWLALGGLTTGGAIAAGFAAERPHERVRRRLYPALPLLAFAVLGLTWLASL